MDTLQWASVKEGVEPRILYCFRVFRAFRGLNDFYYSCPLVSISGSIIIPFVFFRGLLIVDSSRCPLNLVSYVNRDQYNGKMSRMA